MRLSTLAYGAVRENIDANGNVLLYIKGWDGALFLRCQINGENFMIVNVEEG